MRYICFLITFLFAQINNAQIGFEKIGFGLSAGKTIKPVEYIGRFGNIKKEIDNVVQFDNEIFYGLNRRFSLTSGLSLSYSRFTSDALIESQNHLDLYLTKIEDFNVSIPLHLFFRTYMGNKCSTFATIGIRQHFSLHEKEYYNQNYLVDISLIRIESRDYIETSKWQFRPYSTDFEVSVGNFWYLKTIDAQLIMQPILVFYSYKMANKSDVRSDINIHKNIGIPFDGFRFKVSLIKSIAGS